MCCIREGCKPDPTASGNHSDAWRGKHRVLRSYLHCIQLERLLVQQAHVGGLVDADCILVHAGKVPAAAAKVGMAMLQCPCIKGAQRFGLQRRSLHECCA